MANNIEHTIDTSPMATMMTLTEALSVRDIYKLPGAWQLAIGDDWHVAINGHDQPKTAGPDGSEIDLPPYRYAVWCGGWLVATWQPTDEYIVFGNGDAVNAATFAEAVEGFLES